MNSTVFQVLLFHLSCLYWTCNCMLRLDNWLEIVQAFRRPWTTPIYFVTYLFFLTHCTCATEHYTMWGIICNGFFFREIEMCRLTSDFIDICKDSVRPASSRVRSRSRTRSSDSDSGDNMQVAIFQKAATPTRSSSPILKLSKTQERLLKNTIPLHGQWWPKWR